MRTGRRRRRVAEIEWFDALYRVYLAALIGGFVAIFLSEQVNDAPFTATQIEAVMHDGPRVAGLIVAVTIFLGLRSGANGGPLSIEDAEVSHVLLAPVDRGAVLRRPAAQRLRTLAFAGAITGGATGLLIGKRMPAGWETSRAGFVMLAALGGAVTGASFVAVALLAHGLRPCSHRRTPRAPSRRSVSSVSTGSAPPPPVPSPSLRCWWRVLSPCPAVCASRRSRAGVPSCRN
jgi:hypothetical protein